MKLTGFTLLACTTTVCGSRFTDYLRELSPLIIATNETQMNNTFYNYETQMNDTFYNFTNIYSLDMFKKSSKKSEKHQER